MSERPSRIFSMESWSSTTALLMPWSQAGLTSRKPWTMRSPASEGGGGDPVRADFPVCRNRTCLHRRTGTDSSIDPGVRRAGTGSPAGNNHFCLEDSGWKVLRRHADPHNCSEVHRIHPETGPIPFRVPPRAAYPFVRGGFALMCVHSGWSAPSDTGRGVFLAPQVACVGCG